MRQVQLQHYIGSHAERWRLLTLKVEQGDNLVVAKSMILFRVRMVWITLLSLKHSGAERICLAY